MVALVTLRSGRPVPPIENKKKRRLRTSSETFPALYVIIQKGSTLSACCFFPGMNCDSAAVAREGFEPCDD